MEDSRFKISRRQFLTIAGATAGIAAMGYAFRWFRREPFIENESDIDEDKFTEEFVTTDVLVIGGGMAGLFAAVKAHDAGAKVLIVSKGRLGCSGQTPFAKGFFVFDEKTSPYTLDEYVDAVTRSALGSNNRAYTRQVAMYSKDRAEELKKWGFFDSSLCHKPFLRPIKERGIEVKERVMVTHLIKENGVIAGAAGFSLDEEKIYFFNAKSVILCTGAGGFKPYGFPIRDLTHDGSVMAYEIGARITGKEWNDGHTTQAQNPADCYSSWHGIFENKPSITGVEVHHDLGVELNYIAYVKGGPVSMGEQLSQSDISGGPYVPEEFRRTAPERREVSMGESGPPSDMRPPQDGELGRGGPGMMGEIVGGASAGLAIHKSEGLVPINDRCATDIPGLYAAGDALGSHQSGGIYTQIGSSLAGSAVQGAIAGEEAANYAKQVEVQNISDSTMSSIRKEILAPLSRDSGYSAALTYVEELRDHHVPMLVARDLHELRLAHETKNMIINAEMKLRASLFREESRLSHFRLDFPDMDDENWRVWVNIYKGSDGEMKLEKQPFGYWPNGEPIEG